jgi:hypothetical protein
VVEALERCGFDDEGRHHMVHDIGQHLRARPSKSRAGRSPCAAVPERRARLLQHAHAYMAIAHTMPGCAHGRQSRGSPMACGLTPKAAAMMSPHDVPSTTPTGRWGILSVMALLIFSSVSSRESTACTEQAQQSDRRGALHAARTDQRPLAGSCPLLPHHAPTHRFLGPWLLLWLGLCCS